MGDQPASRSLYEASCLRQYRWERRRPARGEVSGRAPRGTTPGRLVRGSRVRKADAPDPARTGAGAASGRIPQSTRVCSRNAKCAEPQEGRQGRDTTLARRRRPCQIGQSGIGQPARRGSAPGAEASRRPRRLPRRETRRLRFTSTDPFAGARRLFAQAGSEGVVPTEQGA